MVKLMIRLSKMEYSPANDEDVEVYTYLTISKWIKQIFINLKYKWRMFING